MCVVKRGKFYHYDFIVAGDRYRGSTKQTTETRAETFEHKLKMEINEGRHLEKRTVRLAEFSTRFLEWVENCRLDPDTKRYYKNGWRMLEKTKLAGMVLSKITNDDVEILGPSEHSAYNINCARRTLRRMLSKAVEWKLLREAVEIGLERENAREKIFNAEQQKDYLNRCPQPLLDVSMLIFDTGMRPDEVYRMRWEDVDFSQKSIFIPWGKTRNSRRFVPLSARCEMALMILRAQQERATHKRIKGSPWVFPSKTSKSGYLSPMPCNRRFRAVRDAMGLGKEYVLYSGRHTFGTEVMENTGNLKLVMKVMGHSDVKTAMRYVHPEIDLMRGMIDRRNSGVPTIVTPAERLQ